VHVLRVAQALVVQRPDGARRGVLVFALHLRGGDLAHAAGEGTVLEGVARVGSAFPASGPARTVVVGILARALADAAGDRAVQVHVVWILTALVVVRPMVAVREYVSTFRRTEPAGGGTVLKHVVWRRLALALLSPG